MKTALSAFLFAFATLPGANQAEPGQPHQVAPGADQVAPGGGDYIDPEFAGFLDFVYGTCDDNAGAFVVYAPPENPGGQRRVTFRPVLVDRPIDQTATDIHPYIWVNGEPVGLLYAVREFYVETGEGAELRCRWIVDYMPPKNHPGDGDLYLVGLEEPVFSEGFEGQ